MRCFIAYLCPLTLSNAHPKKKKLYLVLFVKSHNFLMDGRLYPQIYLSLLFKGPSLKVTTFIWNSAEHMKNKIKI